MTEHYGSTDNGFWRAVGNFFKFLLRFLFVLIIGGLIGVGLYFGVPWAYRNLVEPVRLNSRNLMVLEKRSEVELSLLKEADQTLKKRISELEAQLPALREADAVQSGEIDELSDQLTTVDEQIATMETTVDARFAPLEEMLAAQTRALDEVKGALAEDIRDLNERVDTVVPLQGDIAERTDTLEGRLALLQTAQDLLKVRLLLLEENTRTAKDTVLLTSAHLDQAITLLPEEEATLVALQERVVALGDLIDQRSFRVGPELDALWAEVMDLVLPAELPVTSEEEPAPQASPQVATSPIATPTPTASQ